MLETAMASGICSMGVDVLLVGPLPTPGIAFLTRTLRADAGVVISASHNVFQDNGIKFFSRTGFKLPDEIEGEIEHLVLSDSTDTLRPTATAIGKAFRIDDAVGRYNVFVKNTFPRHLTLDGFKIVVDCGHGAAYRVAPEVLEELGARVIALGVEPDGENINQDCGALYPELLQETVRRTGANVGVALDGDADRAIFVDDRGEVVDGDEVMAMCGAALDERGELRERTLVATVMSNLGLHLAMRERGIAVRTTPVGDRHVVEEMVRGGYNVGGGQSGRGTRSELAGGALAEGRGQGAQDDEPRPEEPGGRDGRRGRHRRPEGVRRPPGGDRDDGCQRQDGSDARGLPVRQRLGEGA